MHPKLVFRNFTVDLLHGILSSTLPLAVCTAASPHFTLYITKILNHIWDVWSSSLSHITVNLASSTAPVLIWFISTCPSYFYYVIKEEYENCHTNYCSHTYTGNPDKDTGCRFKASSFYLKLVGWFSLEYLLNFFRYVLALFSLDGKIFSKDLWTYFKRIHNHCTVRKYAGSYPQLV